MQETPNTPNNTKMLAGIQFSRAGKIEYYLAEGLELVLHDLVVVQGEHIDVIGTVIVPPKAVPATDVATNIHKVIRKADSSDIENHNQDMEQASEAFELCEDMILKQGLPMKLVDVSLEEKKAIFFFFAEERVDFRSLVKDLANTIHMRIEMRQIGARDEAKGIGAIGPCGLVCCCEAHLREFNSISISMAKNQGLSPNPSKLTGMCGKLKCCLAYENHLYLEERRDLPPIGSAVEIPQGKGHITNIDVLRHLCSVRVQDSEKNEEIKVKCSECKILTKPKRVEKEEAEKDASEKEYEKLEG